MYTLTQFVIGPLVNAALGAFVVALVWTIVTLIRARHGGIREAAAKSIPEAIGLMGLVAILSFALVPNPGIETTVNVIPIRGFLSNLLSSNWEIALINALGNIALFVPIGVCLRWRFGLQMPRAALIGLVLSVFVEALQLLLNNGRSVDVDDVLLNVAGTVLGVALTTRIIGAVARSAGGVSSAADHVPT